MKKALFITTFIILTSSFSLIGQSYSIDLKNSNIEWIGYAELGGYSQSGNLAAFSGTIDWANEEVQSAEVIIDMRSIISNDTNLASHLQNKDFFNVKKYPFAELKMTSKTKGTITIKEITKDIVLVYMITEIGTSIKVSGQMKLDRTQFNMKYNSPSFFDNLGDQAIKNCFDIKFELVFIQ